MLARERVYRAIKKDVLSGVHRMGERLPVDELAEQYGVSKTPVREALSALEHEGLVDIVPRVGYFVAQMTVGEVRNLFQIRRILEGASAEIASQTITEVELSALAEIPCNWDTGDIDSYLQYLEDNKEFHCRVAMATRNQHLAELVSSILDQMQGLLLWELELRNRPEEFADEHQQLLNALRRRDGVTARKAMEAAIHSSQQTLLEAVVGGLDLPIVSADSARM
jgi:DNA-binding GntR family transcriptional regulator